MTNLLPALVFILLVISYILPVKLRETLNKIINNITRPCQGGTYSTRLGSFVFGIPKTTFLVRNCYSRHWNLLGPEGFLRSWTHAFSIQNYKLLQPLCFRRCVNMSAVRTESVRCVKHPPSVLPFLGKHWTDIGFRSRRFGPRVIPNCPREVKTGPTKAQSVFMELSIPS